MTIEQINKGADSYIELISAGKASEEMKGVLKSAFASGSHMANEYWQEKTRWTPVEERLPEIFPLKGVKGLEVGYPVLVKVTDTVYGDCYYVATLHQIANDKPFWMLNSAKQLFGVTHWKEIE